MCRNCNRIKYYKDECEIHLDAHEILEMTTYEKTFMHPETFKNPKEYGKKYSSMLKRGYNSGHLIDDMENYPTFSNYVNAHDIDYTMSYMKMYFFDYVEKNASESKKCEMNDESDFNRRVNSLMISIFGYKSYGHYAYMLSKIPDIPTFEGEIQMMYRQCLHLMDNFYFFNQIYEKCEEE
jgi:hypothetical protein